MLDTETECMCRNAVENAYRKLRELGHTDIAAFDSATIIYRNYHPEVSVQRAKVTIADWLDSEV